MFKKKKLFFLNIQLSVISFLIGINRGNQALEFKQNHFIPQYQVDDSNQLQITITDRLRSTSTYHGYYADVITLNDKKISGKLLIGIQKEDSLELNLCFTLKTSDALKPIQASNDIGGFNYKSYLLSIGVSHQLNLYDFIELKRECFIIYVMAKNIKIRKTRYNRIQYF